MKNSARPAPRVAVRRFLVDPGDSIHTGNWCRWESLRPQSMGSGAGAPA